MLFAKLFINNNWMGFFCLTLLIYVMESSNKRTIFSNNPGIVRSAYFP